MPKYEIGDVLKCKEGFDNTDMPTQNGGAGYEEGRIGTVSSISAKECINPIYWFEEFGSGIFEHALELLDKDYKAPKYTIWR